MNAQKKSQIRDLFRAAGLDPQEPLQLIDAYNDCRILIGLKKPNDSYTAGIRQKQFGKYARMPVWEQRIDMHPAIDKLCDALEKENLCDTDVFIGSFIPYLLMDAARFSGLYSAQKESVKLAALTVLQMLRESALKNNVEMDDADKLYGLLCVNGKQNILDNLGLDRVGFDACWKAMNSCNIENIPAKINGRISKAIKSYREKMVPLSCLMEDLNDVKKHRETLERALNPWKHLNREIKKLPVEGGKTIAEALFDTAAFTLKSELPSDVIRAAFYPRGRNDSGLELGFALEKFAELSCSEGNILVVNPSPDVILKCAEFDDRFTGKTAFAVTDGTIASLYKTQFPAATIISIGEIRNLQQSPGCVLLFARDLEPEQLKCAFGALDTLQDGGSAMLLLPNAIVDSRDFGFRDILRADGCSVESIFLLPSGSSNSTPRKKALLTISKNIPAASEHIPLYSGKYEDGRLCRDGGIVNVDRRSFDSGKYTLKALGKGADRGKDTARRNPPREYRFSDEISIWYTLYEGRKNRFAAKAYYSETLTDNKRGRLKGKSITPATERGLRAKTEQEVMSKLESLPFNTDLHFQQAIMDDISGAYSNDKQSLSLKTIWFCCRPALLSVRGYNDELAKRLFFGENNGLGRLNPAAAKEEDYQREMEALGEGDALSLMYWRQLDHVMRAAVKQGYAQYNPIYELLDQVSQRATKEQQEVRNALTKKSFTSAENRRIFNYLNVGIKTTLLSRHVKRYEAESVWLAGAIRMFTGMAAREVCALMWKDMLHLPGAGCYQFTVSKFVGSNGVVLRHAEFEDWQRFRRVPIAPTLAAMLLDRKQYIASAYGISGRDLKNLPIILPRSREKLLGQEKDIGHCSIDTANAACRELIAKADIPQQLLLLPGEKRDVKTDIYKYQGDIFQSNFKFWATHACGLTRGELCYMLGNSPPDTFSKHYCDYTNDLIQYAIANKLERWVRALTARNDESPRCVVGLVAGSTEEVAEPYSDEVACMDIVFEINQSGGMLTVEADQQFGSMGNYAVYEEDGI